MTNRELHEEAMRLSHLAFVALEEGNEQEALALYSQAYENEKKVALDFLINGAGKEFSKAMVFKSAATLAKKAKLYREAEVMLSFGLTVNAPTPLLDELRNMQDEINFSRHLQLNGLQLDNNEIQFSLVGNSVSFGKIHSKEFLNRFQIMEQITYRTAERFEKMPYRKTGTVSSEIKHLYEPYLSVPVAGSYAVTICLSKPESQLGIFEDTRAQKVIDEILFCIEKINNNDLEAIEDHIQDKEYSKDFIAKAKALAPDGDKIKQVGLTVLRNGKEKTVSYQKIGKEIKVNNKPISSETVPTNQVIIEQKQLVGILQVADGGNNKIKIVTKNEGTKVVFVPSGLKDIVKIFFEEEVVINVEWNGKKMTMIDILEA